MKKIFNNINIIICLFVIVFATSCHKDDEAENLSSEYGYFQLKLNKDILSRGITSGSELDYLYDAKKVSVDLLVNNVQVSQTLNLLSFDEESAEFGLTTESVKLMSGNYKLTGYKIYGKYVDGATAPILQAGQPSESMDFTVEKSKVSVVDLGIEVKSRGKLSLVLDKDFSNIPLSKSSEESNFNYADVEKVILKLQIGLNAPTDYEFKVYNNSNEYIFHTDTITLEAGEYKCTQVRLFKNNDILALPIDNELTIKVVNQELTRESIVIDMPLTDAIKDYIALYNIWQKMDGESWYWRGDNHKVGANWMFEYSDGTARPIDTWGYQPGVTLGDNGRVVSLNLGGFNPAGAIPAEIGELTELYNLYLGSFNATDNDFIDPDENTKVIDKYGLLLKGVDIQANRIEIAKEEFRLRSKSNRTSLYGLDNSGNEYSKYKYVTTTQNSMNVHITNRITSIPEEIANCTELTNIVIANGLISTLPNSLSKLDKLTDLSIYNSPFVEVPAVVAKLNNLISFMFSENKFATDKLYNSIDRLFKGNSSDELQLLYFNGLNLASIPASLSGLDKIGLIDFSDNKISSLPALGNNVSLIMCVLDDNLITHVPDDWFNTDDLEEISMVRNKLTVFPNMFDANSDYTVKEVDFSSNSISSFPLNFKGVKIEILNISDNKFSRFPGAFVKTKSEIQFLRVSNNGMTEILDEDIEGFRSLIAFEANTNMLDSIPDKFNRETFPYLNAVDLGFNSFKKFPYIVLSIPTLATLIICEQYQNGKKSLSEWPEKIEEHGALRVLQMQGNDVRNVDKFPLLLNYLDISGNPNIYMKLSSRAIYLINSGEIKFIFDKDQNVVPE